MKTKLFFALLLAPFIISAKTIYQSKINSTPVDSVAGTSVVLKNDGVIFQKVFSSPLKKEALIAQLNTLLAAKRKFKFEASLNDNDFIGRLVKYNIDYSKFNPSIFSPATIITNPLAANVVIQVKDFKYRVTVSEITFINVMPVDKKNPGYPVDIKLDNYITQKKRSKLSTKKGDVKLTEYINQDFTDLFDLSKSNTSGDF